MNGLSDKVMSRLLDGEDESKVLFFDWVVATFSLNQDSTEIIDGLLDAFIIFCVSRIPKEWFMALTYSKNGFP